MGYCVAQDHANVTTHPQRGTGFVLALARIRRLEVHIKAIEKGDLMRLWACFEVQLACDTGCCVA